MRYKRDIQAYITAKTCYISKDWVVQALGPPNTKRCNEPNGQITPNWRASNGPDVQASQTFGIVIF
jgi:hypothetical protein